MYDGQAAPMLLRKHHKLFSDRVEMGGKLNILGFEEALEKVYGKRKSKR